VRKRKQRKNTTKGWFPKETPNENVASSSAPVEDVAASSAPPEDVAASSALPEDVAPSSPSRIQKKSCLLDGPQEEECHVLVSNISYYVVHCQT
jgi:hypothetical protein